MRTEDRDHRRTDQDDRIGGLWGRSRAPLDVFLDTSVEDEAGVEDRLVEVFSTVQEQVAELERIPDLGAWLYRVAHDTVIAHDRRCASREARTELRSRASPHGRGAALLASVTPVR